MTEKLNFGSMKEFENSLTNLFYKSKTPTYKILKMYDWTSLPLKLSKEIHVGNKNNTEFVQNVLFEAYKDNLIQEDILLTQEEFTDYYEHETKKKIENYQYINDFGFDCTDLFFAADYIKIIDVDTYEYVSNSDLKSDFLELVAQEVI